VGIIETEKVLKIAEETSRGLADSQETHPLTLMHVHIPAAFSMEIVLSSDE
jgi:hypothetical protein